MPAGTALFRKRLRVGSVYNTLHKDTTESAPSAGFYRRPCMGSVFVCPVQCVQYSPNPHGGITLAGSLRRADIRTGTSVVVQHARARKRKEKTAATAARRISSSQPCAPPQRLCTTACVRVGCCESFVISQRCVTHLARRVAAWSRPAFRAARIVGTRGLRSLDFRTSRPVERRSFKARGFHRDEFSLQSPQSSSLAPFTSAPA